MFYFLIVSSQGVGHMGFCATYQWGDPHHDFNLPHPTPLPSGERDKVRGKALNFLIRGRKILFAVKKRTKNIFNIFLKRYNTK